MPEHKKTSESLLDDLFYSHPLIQSAYKYREGLKVLFDVDSKHAISFADATYEIKRGNRAVAVIQLKQKAISTYFFIIQLYDLAKANGVDISDEDLLFKWVEKWKHGDAIRGVCADVTAITSFILQHIPAIGEKVFDLLTIAGYQYVRNKNAEESGTPIKFDDAFHQKILELEKEIRRATKTIKPGPKQSWSRLELNAATKKAVSNVIKEGKKAVTLGTVACRVNRDNPNKKPFASKEHNNLGKLGKAFGKRLRDLKISWPGLVEEERRRINGK